MDACWVWEGVRDKDGYGRVWIDGHYYRAHRVVWEDEYGPIPDGILVCHLCDNPPCVRPDHLFLGTQKDNIADMLEKGRRPAHYAVRQVCEKGHPLEQFGKQQRCRTCWRAYDREWKRRKRAGGK